jgi:hypothetical protein
MTDDFTFDLQGKAPILIHGCPKKNDHDLLENASSHTELQNIFLFGNGRLRTREEISDFKKTPLVIVWKNKQVEAFNLSLSVLDNVEIPDVPKMSGQVLAWDIVKKNFNSGGGGGISYVGSGGQKKYTVASYYGLQQLIRTHNNQPGGPCGYEIIKGPGIPCKLVVDAEVDLRKIKEQGYSPLLFDGEEFDRTFRKDLREFLCLRISPTLFASPEHTPIIPLDSSKPGVKWSSHYIVQAAFAGLEHVGLLMREFMAYVVQKHGPPGEPRILDTREGGGRGRVGFPNPYFVQKSKTINDGFEFDCVIDLGIYTSNRCFRPLGCCKCCDIDRTFVRSVGFPPRRQVCDNDGGSTIGSPSPSPSLSSSSSPLSKEELAAQKYHYLTKIRKNYTPSIFDLATTAAQNPIFNMAWLDYYGDFIGVHVNNGLGRVINSNIHTIGISRVLRPGDSKKSATSSSGTGPLTHTSATSYPSNRSMSLSSKITFQFSAFGIRENLLALSSPSPSPGSVQHHPPQHHHHNRQTREKGVSFCHIKNAIITWLFETSTSSIWKPVVPQIKDTELSRTTVQRINKLIDTNILSALKRPDLGRFEYGTYRSCKRGDDETSVSPSSPSSSSSSSRHTHSPLYVLSLSPISISYGYALDIQLSVQDHDWILTRLGQIIIGITKELFPKSTIEESRMAKKNFSVTMMSVMGSSLIFPGGTYCSTKGAHHGKADETFFLLSPSDRTLTHCCHSTNCKNKITYQVQYKSSSSSSPLSCTEEEEENNNIHTTRSATTRATMTNHDDGSGRRGEFVTYQKKRWPRHHLGELTFPLYNYWAKNCSTTESGRRVRMREFLDSVVAAIFFYGNSIASNAQDNRRVLSEGGSTGKTDSSLLTSHTVVCPPQLTESFICTQDTISYLAQLESHVDIDVRKVIQDNDTRQGQQERQSQIFQKDLRDHKRVTTKIDCVKVIMRNWALRNIAVRTEFLLDVYCMSNHAFKTKHNGLDPIDETIMETDIHPRRRDRTIQTQLVAVTDRIAETRMRQFSEFRNLWGDAFLTREFLLPRGSSSSSSLEFDEMEICGGGGGGEGEQE